MSNETIKDQEFNPFKRYEKKIEKNESYPFKRRKLDRKRYRESNEEVENESDDKRYDKTRRD